MSSEESETDFIPPNLIAEAELAINNLLPPKSKERYLKTYEKFISWRREQNTKSLSETVFLAYFSYLRQTMKPSSLWPTYSMLRCVLHNKNNLNLRSYTNLTAWLKRQSDGYQCKKSKIFSSQNIQQFLNEAPDDKYLVTKVVLIIGINGACRSLEIANIKISDVEYHNDIIIIKLRETKTKLDRSFVIRDESANIVKKYQALRPKELKSDNLLLNYKNGRCTKQNIGRHKIAAMPKDIATYLNLSNPEAYTGHCFRRSSATLLADSGANLLTVKRHGGWKSDRVAEDYIEDSVENKADITKKINTHIKLESHSIPKPPTSNQQHMFLNPQPSTSRQESGPSQVSNFRPSTPPATEKTSDTKQTNISMPEPSTSNQEQFFLSPQPSAVQQESVPLQLSNTEPSVNGPVLDSHKKKSDIKQTNISMPGKSITISIENCPNMNNVTFNIS